MSAAYEVHTAEELVTAAAVEGAQIDIAVDLGQVPALTLAPGVSLRGGAVRFAAKGLRLTADNRLDGVVIETAVPGTAIDTDNSVPDWGVLRLSDVRTTGQVRLIADGATRAGRVVVDGLQVLAADVRGRTDRPRAYHVEALQGGFTLWNRQTDAASVITADLRDISAGSAATPIRGSGVFVGGQVDGGSLAVDLLRTGEIHSDGGIAQGTPDLISGGVFVITGARVSEVVNQGPVTTYGPNDMVLDNWGQVGQWRATEPIVSHGPSGIGVVNFGGIDEFIALAPVITHGEGARGFNLYDGRLDRAAFAAIETFGDGGVGIQVSRELPVLEIEGDLVTHGGAGTSLVKGVQVPLSAMALSVQRGGRIGAVRIGGVVRTSGAGVTAVDVAGEIDVLDVAGGIEAADGESLTIQAEGRVGSVAGFSDGRPAASGDRTRQRGCLWLWARGMCRRRSAPEEAR